MNKQWSEQNKLMQSQLGRRETYAEGLKTLFALRDDLMKALLSFRDTLADGDFYAQPFPNAEGYHSKTVTYSLWHIFRIEDIVAHTLINGDEQVLFSGNYIERIHSPIITTGNELVGQKIAEFSKELDLNELYSYISDVKTSTEKILSGLTFDMLKNKISPERRKELIALNTVSSDENAVWLIDYWCKKDIRELIQMPFSRHWIMHTEACLRIISKIDKTKK